MIDPTFLNPISILTQFDVGGKVTGGGGISIDITQKLTENYPKIITTNPIEDGSPTTDHMTNLPPRIQIEGGFSDLKMNALVGTAFSLSSGRNRAKDQFDRLLELSISNELFSLMDGLHYFRNMQFSNLQLLKDREGFSVFFSADIQGIRVINIGLGTQSAISVSDVMNRAVIASTSLLTVGSTVDKNALETLGILA
jgi:hypothetical protein